MFDIWISLQFPSLLRPQPTAESSDLPHISRLIINHPSEPCSAFQHRGIFWGRTSYTTSPHRQGNESFFFFFLNLLRLSMALLSRTGLTAVVQWTKQKKRVRVRSEVGGISSKAESFQRISSCVFVHLLATPVPGFSGARAVRRSSTGCEPGGVWTLAWNSSTFS